MKRAIIAAVLLAMSASAAGQQAEFRWVTAVTDPVVFRQIKSAFLPELTPDRDDPQSDTVPMTVKFIDRVGVCGNSALVVIGEKENKTFPYAVFRAFSFNLQNKAKSPVLAKGVEWLWVWRVEKVGHLTSAADTDVIFRFLNCTECEEETLLGSFRYDATHETWRLRDWGGEQSVMVDSHRQFGDDGLHYYDCLHVVADLSGDGLDDVAVRCRESVERRLLRGFSTKPIPRNTTKEVVHKDETVLYTSQGGQFRRILLSNGDELARRVQAALCGTQPRSSLCKR